LSFDRELEVEVWLGHSVAGIASALFRRIGYEVLVEDATGEMMAQAGHEVLSHPLPEGTWRRLGVEAANACAMRQGDHWVAAARPGGMMLGLIAFFDPSAEAGGGELRALEQSAIVLGLELLHLQNIAQTELAAWGDLATELLESSDLARARTHAHRLGYELDRIHRAILIQPLDDRPAHHLATVRSSARGLGMRDVLATTRGTAVVVLVDDAADWSGLARAVVADLHEKVWVGVGSACGPEELGRSLADAQLALALSELIGDGPVTSFDDLGVWRIFSRGDPSVLMGLIERWLGPLIEYDAKHGSELVKTLTAYLGTSCNLTAAANRLFVHRNTLKYRLSRIASMTGRDLDDPEQRFNLDLACHAWRILCVLGHPSIPER
jgi:hypothetical protein